MRWWRRRGLRFKLALGIALTMLLVLGGVFFGIARYIQAQLWQREVQAVESLNAVAATLLEDAMMSGRKDHIQEALEKLGRSMGGQIDAIAMYDDHAVLTSFASSFPGGRSIRQKSLQVDLTDPSCRGCHQLPAGERPSVMVVSLEGKEVMRNVVPLYNELRCQTCHGTGTAVLGDSIVDLRLDRYREASTSLRLGLVGGMALAVVLVALVMYVFLHQTVLFPLESLLTVTQAVAQGDLDRRVEVRSGDEVGQVGEAFNSMTAQLRELIGSLEQRVAERTQDLEQRSAYLEASAEVGQVASSILDTETLAQLVVDLIKARFGLYYVGLFLTDERNEWAILGAGTGEAGKAMLRQGHRLRVGAGMVGWSIAHAEARIALDVGQDAVRFDNPDLPETRSEAALPLRSRGRVLGALTVQHSKSAAFDQDAVTVLQTMADQVAVALDNAAMFAQTQTALEAERRAYGEISREAWAQMLQARPDIGYVCGAQGIRAVEGQWRSELAQAAASGQIVHENGPVLAIPITIRDHVAGAIRLRKPDGALAWTGDEISLMEMLTERLGVALESARLYQDTQRRQARERAISAATSRMREPLELDAVLRTAVSEIRDALDLDELVVRLGSVHQ